MKSILFLILTTVLSSALNAQTSQTDESSHDKNSVESSGKRLSSPEDKSSPLLFECFTEPTTDLKQNSYRGKIQLSASMIRIIPQKNDKDFKSPTTRELQKRDFSWVTKVSAKEILSCEKKFETGEVKSEFIRIFDRYLIFQSVNRNNRETKDIYEVLDKPIPLDALPPVLQ